MNDPSLLQRHEEIKEELEEHIASEMAIERRLYLEQRRVVQLQVDKANLEAEVARLREQIIRMNRAELRAHSEDPNW